MLDPWCMSVKSFRSAFIVLLKSPATRLNIVKLRWNHSEQTTDGKAGLARLSFSSCLCYSSSDFYIVFQQHQNFCLNLIKIWSTPLCSLARHAVPAARLSSNLYHPAYGLQLLSSHFHSEDTHTTQMPIDLIERRAHYDLYIANTYKCRDTNPRWEHKHTCAD